MAVGQITAAEPLRFGANMAAPAGAPTKTVETGVQAAVFRTTQGTRSAAGPEAARQAANTERQSAAAQSALTASPGRLVAAAPGRLPEAAPSNSNVAMVLFDLQSGIRRAQALIQSVSTQVTSASSRLIAAKAYSLEVQAQQEITKLQMQGIGQAHQWFA